MRESRGSIHLKAELLASSPTRRKNRAVASYSRSDRARDRPSLNFLLFFLHRTPFIL